MRKVVIVGLGKSGIAAARLVAAKGDIAFITEIKDDVDTRASLQGLVRDGAVKKGNAELGGHSRGFAEGADLAVVSPGVRQDSPPVKTAEGKGIPVISELELSYLYCPAPIIAVTGTSGKTTVTTLIGEFLKKAGLDAIVCGNIGNPLSGEIKKIKKDSLVVLEVSSFQLERVNRFKPSISVILNISENHLDRHKDMEEYVSLKSRIFRNQDKDDLVFLNGQDELLMGLSREAQARVEFFDRYRDFRKRCSIENENYLAAMAVGSVCGVKENVMLEVISGFKGIEHRLEHVRRVNGIDFINDSKATTVSSVRWALRSLEGGIVLIMGGRYKGGDFGLLAPLVKEKVDCVVAIGEAGPRIRECLSSFGDVLEADDLEGAVRTAFGRVRKGGKVLLSPGCSSFDMFRNYEERGRSFKDACSRLSIEHPVKT